MTILKKSFHLSLFFVLIFTFYETASAQTLSNTFSVTSPDKNIELSIFLTDEINYEVIYNNNKIIELSKIALTIRGHETLGTNPTLIDSKTTLIDEIIKPVVAEKSSSIENLCNELTLSFERNFDLVFRAYNDGIAYRFITNFDGDIIVESEDVNFNFMSDHSIYFPEEVSFFSHQERVYKYLKISEIEEDKFSSIPAMIEMDEGTKVLITEADLYNYPGFYLTPKGNNGLSAIFPHYPLKEEKRNDRDVEVIEYEDYLAKSTGERNFPWRVLIITDDAGLISSQMIYKLSSPLKLENTEWIKPGKVAWDWWNSLNIYGVDFKSGVNNETYKHFIDFASANNIEYVILDEGWYKLGDLFNINPDIDMEALVKYSEEKNVGLILWVVWKTLYDQMEEALDQFEKWGVAGIKVDFMQRDDQWMVEYYELIAREAAKRKLIVDFHGAYKPSGLRRAYPNVLTREGVRGLEWSKWSEFITPEHCVTLPFIRMAAGPMDFTPGAMLNTTEGNFLASHSRPMSQGTRCQQLALYVIYESPLQMLCDSPSNYRKEKESLDFIAKVPTVWDEIKVLHAKVGDYVVLARRSGDEWYIGGITDWSERDFELNLDFLPKGDYKIDLFIDGINADKYAGDYKRIQRKITSDEILKVHLAPGGGMAARIYK
ncbi:MAG: glycoside hydrolase family 97 protein [Melioribacteraceae bacterium]|nr:glycoside hydrolase family 97 protein [Melioribacteraceae bacterium]MCF8353215.1 glycoside hydrolase family 97 protein [Melioribacteraceae bacterium]MCF8395606.1 glycoside hydrolase family 97 protein [Melioribacteraceae bacterium]MCF8418751.1 glycoside hydrolase family 97 protein [Melioribacteraceae bacterium]